MATTLSSAPADEKSVEVAIQHARDAVTEAQEDDGWVLIRDAMLSLLLEEIEQLRLDREQHAGNASAVLQAQHERDAAMAHVQALNERITVIPSPSALCALLGCKLQQVHVHDVIEDAGTAVDVTQTQTEKNNGEG